MARGNASGGRAPKRAVSLNDVAAAAGVGVGTASRAMSGRGYVGEAARERVLAAASRLGYTPNRLAAGLRSNRSNLIALLVPDFTNEFYSVGSAAAEQLLRDEGYQLIVASSQDGDQERETVRSLAQYNVDGIIRVPVDPTTELAVNCPVVELNRRSGHRGVSSVVCDDRAGFEELTAEILHAGYTEITMVVGDEDFSTTRERIEGCRAAIDAAVSPDVTLAVRQGTYSASWGYEVARDLLAHRDEGSVPAIIAASPRIASGVVRACTELGVNAPADLALAAYSHPEWFDYWGGGIQSFVPPLEDMARSAVRKLLHAIHDPSSPTENLVLSGSLHRGGSVATPPGGNGRL